jgi:SagB-type dehydrogenase family enzyme
VSKLAWLLLPLLAAAAAVLVLVLARRTPTRLALNVLSSLLLLIYLLATAGLGIFWVANQQLPVFDWHYLFGYATLLLLVLHLAFNFRVVWQVLRRPAAPRPDRARRPALSLLALLGLGAGLGGAFWLGLRHGRTEISLAAQGPAAHTGLALVESFHEFSAHSRHGVLRRAPATDWGDAPAPFKSYPGRPRLALDRHQGVGALMWHTAGVSLWRGGMAFRTAPSSGALFATELYLAVHQLRGVAPGLWHYDAQAHALEQLADALPPPWDVGSTANAPAATVIATAVFRRSGHKYRDRTYRYVLADLGHALENLRVAAGALGHRLALAPCFDEAAIARALFLDEDEEGVLALGVLDGAEPDCARAQRWLPGPGAAPASSQPAARGVTETVHKATSLRPVSPATPAPALLAISRAHALPESSPAMATAAAGSPLEGIARRRSIRRFAATPLSQVQLTTLLRAMAGEAPQLSPALRVDVLTHAVQALAPAAWRYDARGQRLLPRTTPQADLRQRSRAAALDQDVIGDAAAVFVLSIDRAAFAADALGPARGYRHAFIEAGLLGERLYLQGGALGLGVCAVGAFYDDEVSQLVGVDPALEWVVHLAAVGVPG